MRPREPFYLASLVGAVLLLLSAHAACAADTDLDSKAGALDRGVTKQERSAMFTKFGVPNTALYTALPPGQALLLYSLCGSNTACQTQALIDRNAHMGWGKVVEDLEKDGLTTADKVGEAVSRVTDAHSDLVAKHETDKAEKQTEMVDKTEKVAKTEKVEKMDKPEPVGRVERPERPERPWR